MYAFMQPTRNSADIVGWILGVVILLLALLDIFVLVTLWADPNPISKWLLGVGSDSLFSAPQN
jgi:hypothetical protein